jgi:hypothetical protein
MVMTLSRILNDYWMANDATMLRHKLDQTAGNSQGRNATRIATTAAMDAPADQPHALLQTCHNPLGSGRGVLPIE